MAFLSGVNFLTVAAIHYVETLKGEEYLHQDDRVQPTDGAASADAAAVAWSVGQAFASTGTAFPSSHVAVTAAILFEVLFGTKRWFVDKTGRASSVGSGCGVKSGGINQGGGDRSWNQNTALVGGRVAGMQAGSAVLSAVVSVLVPLIWIATVWCGFHFVLDGIAGVAVAAACRACNAHRH
jgi:hypothetical protein